MLKLLFNLVLDVDATSTDDVMWTLNCLSNWMSETDDATLNSDARRIMDECIERGLAHNVEVNVPFLQRLLFLAHRFQHLLIPDRALEIAGRLRLAQMRCPTAPGTHLLARQAHFLYFRTQNRDTHTTLPEWLLLGSKIRENIGGVVDFCLSRKTTRCQT